MSDSLNKSRLAEIITNVNREFGVNLHTELFNASEYSKSSIRDILVQRIAEEKNDEWTIDKSLAILQKHLSDAAGINAKDIHSDAELSALLPKSKRRAIVKAMQEKSGLKMDILKPNGIVYGILIFLFFACIPFGIGMDWFFSGIVMVVVAILIFIMGKTANELKFKTVGQWAEKLTWDNYLKNKKDRLTLNDAEIGNRLDKIL